MAQSKLSEKDLVEAVSALSAKEFESVMCKIAKVNPHPGTMKYITNKFQKARKASGSLDDDNDQREIPQPMPGRDGRSSRVLGSSPFASLLPDIPGASAWQVPMIFRGDLVPKNGKLFIDVEKLSMKIDWNGGRPTASKPKHKQVANNVAIVDEYGTLILWAFIRRNPNDICQYMTSLHRIDKAKIVGGVDITTVRVILEKCLRGNMLVGAKLADDLKSLSLDKEYAEGKLFGHNNAYDLQDFYRDSKGAHSLKDLVSHFFPEKTAEFQSGAHSSISDARMTLKLYLKMCELQKEDPDLKNTLSLSIKRNKKPKFIYDPKDICKCNGTK